MDPLPQIVFILSAGRTGTVFLTNALRARLPAATIVHEPWPGRYGLLLANVRRRYRTSGRLLRHLLILGLRARLRRATEAGRTHYIEINPFLCACIDLLPTLGFPFRVIHMVRAPREWARSITTFRASGYRRRVIRFIPFSMPFPEPRPEGWRRLSDIEKGVWRWRFCNEEIGRFNDGRTAYLRLRYEEVFSPDEAVRRRQAAHLAAFLEVDEHFEFDVAERVNSSAGLASTPDTLAEAFVDRVAGSLARELGYGRADYD